MKRLFLASSIDCVASDIAKHIGQASNLKTVFISTAAEVETGDKQWFKDDRQGLVNAGFDLFDYTLTGKNLKQLETDLAQVDVIHVNGGNSFYLLLQARISGFDQFVKKAVNQGKIYLGSSAGSLVASPDISIAETIEAKAYEAELKTFEAFNLVDFIVLPHWGNKHFKDLYLNHRLDTAYKKGNKLILLNDDQYVEVKDDWYQIVDVSKSSRL